MSNCARMPPRPALKRVALTRTGLVLAVVGVVATLTPASGAVRSDRPARPVPEAAPARADVPEDRYALAGGCYALQSLATGGWVVREGDGFAATAPDPAAAEPFHFRPPTSAATCSSAPQRSSSPPPPARSTRSPARAQHDRGHHPEPALPTASCRRRGGRLHLVLPDGELALTADARGVRSRPEPADAVGQFASASAPAAPPGRR